MLLRSSSKAADTSGALALFEFTVPGGHRAALAQRDGECSLSKQHLQISETVRRNKLAVGAAAAIMIAATNQCVFVFERRRDRLYGAINVGFFDNQAGQSGWMISGSFAGAQTGSRQPSGR